MDNKTFEVTNKCNTISQLIKHLKNIEKEYGDIEVSVNTQDGGLYDIHEFDVAYNEYVGKFQLIIQ